MKQAWLLPALTFAMTMPVSAQTNPITGITISLPANPDANTANWGSGTSSFVIRATGKGAAGRIDPAVEESRILVIIKKSGGIEKVCGVYAGASAPSANFNTPTKEWSRKTASALLGRDCTLPPGDYELIVQFFSPKGVALSAEGNKAFSVKGR